MIWVTPLCSGGGMRVGNGLVVPVLVSVVACCLWIKTWCARIVRVCESHAAQTARRGSEGSCESSSAVGSGSHRFCQQHRVPICGGTSRVGLGGKGLRAAVVGVIPCPPSGKI